MTRHDPDRADRIVSFVEDFIAEHGYGPSFREICSGVGLASPASVTYHVEKLIREGRMTGEYATSRSLRVPRPGHCPACGQEVPA